MSIEQSPFRDPSELSDMSVDDISQTDPEELAKSYSAHELLELAAQDKAEAIKLRENIEKLRAEADALEAMELNLRARNTIRMHAYIIARDAEAGL